MVTKKSNGDYSFDFKNLDYNGRVATHYKKSLFELVLKASPYPGMLFNPDKQWETPNAKVKKILKGSFRESYFKMLHHCLTVQHPAIFPWSGEGENYYYVSIPLVDSPDNPTRLILLVPNAGKIDFAPPLLTEQAWHELNNPLAIISLTLQKFLKKKILQQEDIDFLMNKLSESFGRIEDFIKEKVALAQN